MSRNYETPAVAAEWFQTRETDEVVAMAIHAIADTARSADAIWEAPTAAEWDHVLMALNEYCACGDIEPGTYCWGQETVEVAGK